MTDSKPGTTVETNPGTSDVTGHVATLNWNGNNPSSLTYYVTKSDPNSEGLGTTETLYQEQYTPGGFIVAGSSKASAVVNVASGSTFNLKSGLLTLKNAYTAATSNIYPQVVYNEGTFNMSGGCLAGVTTSYRGGGVRSVSGSTMNMSGGVIADNTAVSGGGVYMDSGTLNISGGTISGNSVSAATYSTQAEDGYGAGVFAIGSSVTVSGGYITNNRLNAQYSIQGEGLIGGGGMAVFGKNSAGALTISGGYITGNYSQAAGGGVYAGRYGVGLGSFSVTGGTVAANVAQTGEGGGIRVSSGTTGTFVVSAGQKAYVTNNKCNSTYDWGGGGVFVQQGGTLVVKNSLITNNTAGGYGGGVAACPTGQTVVTHVNGTAIYGNTDAGSSESAHMSSGGHGKNMDSTVAYDSPAFRTHGHADYFLVRARTNTDYIAAITGQMLGNGAANWSGSIDGTPTSIDPTSGAEAKYMVGLTASPDDDAKAAAKTAATIIFSGNYSYNHGGAIMTNGGLTLGEVSEVKIYPAMTLDATKSLKQDGSTATLSNREFTFELLRATSDSQKPSWNADGTLNAGGCIVSSEVTNDENGNIHFEVGEDYAAGSYMYYLVEVPTSASDITFDKTIYRIDATVSENTRKQFKLLGITFKYYEVTNLSVTKYTYTNEGSETSETFSPTYTVENNTVGLALYGSQSGTAATFSNVKAPYESTGSFTPRVTKAVTGGDMKEFTFELFTKDSAGNETQVETATNDSDGNVNFAALNKKAGVTAGAGRVALTGGKRGYTTDTYYIREKNDKKTGYTYDTTVYKVNVTWQDDGNGKLTPMATYKKLDSDGNETSEAGNNPTFNNKYAITLPSAGQAGITIAYIAGAVVLAYGVWRLVKARGKSRRGGE
ncbi:Spy0128 family protein [Parafannyhessea sp. LCP21S3_E6]|uniref:Spy0128 family protein n=1 Tax=unclassified Parafannyhessea TaxID=2847323 RepID=UPI003F9E45EF